MAFSFAPRMAVAFPQPLTQCADHFFAQRDAARFASFTDAADVSTGFQGHILAAEANQLRDPQACLQCDQQ